MGKLSPASCLWPVTVSLGQKWHRGQANDVHLLMGFSPDNIRVPYFVYIANLQTLLGVRSMCETAGFLSLQEHFAGWIFRSTHPTVEKWAKNCRGIFDHEDLPGEKRWYITEHSNEYVDLFRKYYFLKASRGQSHLLSRC